MSFDFNSEDRDPRKTSLVLVVALAGVAIIGALAVTQLGLNPTLLVILVMLIIAVVAAIASISLLEDTYL